MLRRRLFLNLIPFVVLLVAVGVYAIILFSHLANRLDGTAMENYRSAVAAQTIGDSVWFMEIALVQAMSAQRTNNPAAAAVQGTNSGFSMTAAEVAGSNLRWSTNELAVARSLTVLIKNAALFKTNLIAELRTNYAGFRAAGLAILGMDQEVEQRRIFTRDAVPRIIDINHTLEKVRQVNHANILATSQHIQQINRHITRLMLVGVAASILICAYASFKLGKSILGPIQLLTKATGEIGAGSLDQMVPVLSNDELGALANAFNRMAAQLKAYRQNTTEQIIHLHRATESTLASFPDPIFVLDGQGRIELRNPAAEDLSAQLELVDTLPAPLADTAGEVLRSGKDFLPHSFKEVQSFRVNDEDRFFLPRILSMRGENGKPLGVAVVLYDVTRFRLLDDAKTNLVATVSHELKSPLTSVRMVLHLLLEKTLGPLTPKQDELLQTARNDAERLLRILNDLLDLTRLEAGNSGLNKERMTAAELTRHIAQEAHSRIAEHGLKLLSSVEPNLPAVLVDRLRIGHVFRNFISNAVKNSPPGGEILVRAAPAGGGVQFSVKDQGPGIPEEYLNRIFERFFRVPGQARTGAGLGLSIAREIVLAHGGRIGVRSRPGHGSEFYVVLTSAEEESSIS